MSPTEGPKGHLSNTGAPPPCCGVTQKGKKHSQPCPAVSAAAAAATATTARAAAAAATATTARAAAATALARTNRHQRCRRYFKGGLAASGEHRTAAAAAAAAASIAAAAPAGPAWHAAKGTLRRSAGGKRGCQAATASSPRRRTDPWTEAATSAPGETAAAAATATATAGVPAAAAGKAVPLAGLWDGAG